MGTGKNQPFDIGHWILRLVALIIDSIIIYIIGWIIYFVVLLPLLFAGVFFWQAYAYTLFLPFVFGILLVLYSAFFEASISATIGKKVIGLKVQLVKGGDKIPFDKALIRNIGKIHPLLLLLDWIIAIVTPGPDQRQKYTDRIAGTTVVQISAPLESLVSVPEENK
jgi:uncharacterized RDD family membrane protein YckC